MTRSAGVHCAEGRSAILRRMYMCERFAPRLTKVFLVKLTFTLLLTRVYGQELIPTLADPLGSSAVPTASLIPTLSEPLSNVTDPSASLNAQDLQPTVTELYLLDYSASLGESTRALDDSLSEDSFRLMGLTHMSSSTGRSGYGCSSFTRSYSTSMFARGGGVRERSASSAFSIPVFATSNSALCAGNNRSATSSTSGSGRGGPSASGRGPGSDADGGAHPHVLAAGGSGNLGLPSPVGSGASAISGIDSAFGPGIGSGSGISSPFGSGIGDSSGTSSQFGSGIGEPLGGAVRSHRALRHATVERNSQRKGTSPTNVQNRNTSPKGPGR